MNIISKAKDKKGFTLMELVITVGIIVALCGISVPGIVAINMQLEMMRADNIAKEIYIASQNKLEQDKKSGAIESLDDTLANLGFTKFSSNKPGDYVGDEETKNNWHEIGSVSSSDVGDSGKLNYVLPASVFKQIPGDYVIEVNPSTGDIYGVFYKECKKGNQLSSLYQADSDSGIYKNRAKSDRQDEYVGYYGGTEARKAFDNGFGAAIAVVNDEELTVNVTLPKSVAITGSSLSLGQEDTVRVKISMKDETGNKKVINVSGAGSSFLNTEPVRISSDSTGRTTAKSDLSAITLNTVLDKIRVDASQPDYAFNATGSTALGLVAGENIVANIDAAITYQGTLLTTTIRSSSHNVKFNSLYRSKKTEVTGDETQQTIKIDKIRHLNNLRSDLVNDFTFKDVNSVKVIQTADIGSKDNTTNLKPISNALLFGGMVSITGGQSLQRGLACYDGHGNELLNFDISGENPANTAATGLFSATNCEIKNTRLVNPMVTGASNTGALVGHMYGGETSKINKCGVYLRNNNAAKNTNIKVNTDIQNNRIVKVATGVSSAENIGGLVGIANNGAEIKNSFAAIEIKRETGHQNVGGFIGNSSASIKNCYSSGAVLDNENEGSVFGGAATGGFAGTVGANSTIDNCYSTADVKTTRAAGNTCGSFAGTVAGKIQDSISYGKLIGANDGCCAFGNPISNGSFVRDYYLKFSNHNDTYTRNYNGITETSSPETASNTTSNTHMYNERSDNSIVFPFSFISKVDDQGILSHYGDWPVVKIEKSDIQLAYYEKYNNNEIRLYNDKMDTLYSQDDLDGDSTNATHVIEDGYAFISKYTDLTSFKIDRVGSTGATPDTINIGTSSDGYTVYRLPYDFQGTSQAPSSLYVWCNIKQYKHGSGGFIDNDNGLYYYCPSLAKAIERSNPVVSESRTMIVRTARQLNNMGRFKLFWNSTNSGYNSLSYVQELDINFANYTTNYCRINGYNINSIDSSYKNAPIGRYNDAFRYRYNGSGYEIIDYKLSTNNSSEFRYTGLFGDTSGATISNVHMVAESPNDNSGYVTAICNVSSADELAGGALIGRLGGGSATNCSQSGYTVTFHPDTSRNNLQADVAVGGLIGTVTGTVDKCSAVSKSVHFQIADYKNLQFMHVCSAGLVGNNTSGTIRNSYSGGELQLNMITATSMFDSHRAFAGISGIPFNQNAAGTVENCYSFCHINPSTQWIGQYTYYAVAPSTTNSYFLYREYNERNAGTTNITKLNTTSELAGIRDSLGSAFGKATASTTYPWSASLSGTKYPYPAVVKAKEGTSSDKYVHYGDWPGGTIATTGSVGIVKVIKTRNATEYESKYYDYGSGAYSDNPQIGNNGGFTIPNVSGLSNGTHYFVVAKEIAGDWTLKIGDGNERDLMQQHEVAEELDSTSGSVVFCTEDNPGNSYTFTYPWDDFPQAKVTSGIIGLARSETTLSNYRWVTTITYKYYTYNEDGTYSFTDSTKTAPEGIDSYISSHTASFYDTSYAYFYIGLDGTATWKNGNTTIPGSGHGSFGNSRNTSFSVIKEPPAEKKYEQTHSIGY